MTERDPSYFYFLGTDDRAEIKIGNSSEPEKRKKQLEFNGGYGGIKLVDLFFMRGWTQPIEDYLKEKLEPFRSRERSTEHYRATPEICDWLRFLWQQPYTGSSIKPCDIQELPVPDPSQWFPSAEHRVPIPTTPLGFVLPSNEGHLAGTKWADLITDAVVEGDYYLPQEEASLIWQLWPDGPDLDVASCKAANKYIGARNYYGAHQMGETKPWKAKSYANPPFDRWDVFYERLQIELKAGRAEEVLAVFPMDKLGIKVGQQFLRTASAACFRKGEVRFEGPLISKRQQVTHLGHAYKGKTSTLDNGHFQTSGRMRIVYFYFGEDLQNFKTIFGRVGAIMTHIDGVPVEVNIPAFEEPEIETESETESETSTIQNGLFD